MSSAKPLNLSQRSTKTDTLYLESPYPQTFGPGYLRRRLSLRPSDLAVARFGDTASQEAEASATKKTVRCKISQPRCGPHATFFSLAYVCCNSKGEDLYTGLLQVHQDISSCLYQICLRRRCSVPHVQLHPYFKTTSTSIPLHFSITTFGQNNGISQCRSKT